MDETAQRCLTILTHLLSDDLTLEEAAVLLDLSTRQVRRLAERFGADATVARPSEADPMRGAPVTARKGDPVGPTVRPEAPGA